MMAKKYTEEELLKKALNNSAADRAKAMQNVSDKYSAKADDYVKQADLEKKSAAEKYADDFNRSSVERMVNQKKLEERLANLGLTDSGYADNLKAANEKSEKIADLNTSRKIEDDKKAIDEQLAVNLDKNLSEMEKESERISDEYDDSAKKQASEELKKLEQAEKQKEKEEAEKEKEESKSEAEKVKELTKKRDDDIKVVKVEFDMMYSKYGKKLTNFQIYDLFDKLMAVENRYKGTEAELTNGQIAEICGKIKTDLETYRVYSKEKADKFNSRYAEKVDIDMGVKRYQNNQKIGATNIGYKEKRKRGGN